MKKTIIALVICLSFQSHAFYAITEGLAYSIAESLYVTALGAGSLEVSTLASKQFTSQNEKEYAEVILKDAIHYYSDNSLSPFLKSVSDNVMMINPSLDRESSVELLVMAGQKILEN